MSNKLAISRCCCGPRCIIEESSIPNVANTNIFISTSSGTDWHGYSFRIQPTNPQSQFGTIHFDYAKIEFVTTGTNYAVEIVHVDTVDTVRRYLRRLLINNTIVREDCFLKNGGFSYSEGVLNCSICHDAFRNVNFADGLLYYNITNENRINVKVELTINNLFVTNSNTNNLRYIFEYTSRELDNTTCRNCQPLDCFQVCPDGFRSRRWSTQVSDWHFGAQYGQHVNCDLNSFSRNYDSCLTELEAVVNSFTFNIGPHDECSFCQPSQSAINESNPGWYASHKETRIPLCNFCPSENLKCNVRVEIIRLCPTEENPYVYRIRITTTLPTTAGNLPSVHITNTFLTDTSCFSPMIINTLRPESLDENACTPGSFGSFINHRPFGAAVKTITLIPLVC